MSRNYSLDTIRERNKRKRMAGWALLYMLLIAGVIYAVYSQAKRVNTLNFANGQIQLVTSKTKYTVGDTISYTLKNGLTEPITLKNNCPQEPFYVYSWTNNSWVRITATASASACNGQPKQYTIKPGGSLTNNFANWKSLFNKPGIYRIVGLASNYTALPYADFQVVPKPVVIKPKVQTQIVIQKVITPVYIQVPTSSGGGDHSSGGGGDN